MDALIGYTGFVGGNLHEQGYFEGLFNSKNIGEMRGREFNTVWCAGISAVKWWANLHPQEDWQGIEPLLKVLDTISVQRFVLISTVDVFKTPLEVDEDTPIDENDLHPYGKHRVAVEQFVRSKFASHTIVRLPGLFGKGLKKNIIYDFLNNNEVEKIHKDSAFQFYSLDTVHRDVMVAVQGGCDLIHFATEPVTVETVANVAFGMPFANVPETPAVRYDMQTKHARLFGEASRYMQSADTVCDSMANFVARSRSNA